MIVELEYIKQEKRLQNLNIYQVRKVTAELKDTEHCSERVQQGLYTLNTRVRQEIAGPVDIKQYSKKGDQGR